MSKKSKRSKKAKAAKRRRLRMVKIALGVVLLALLGTGAFFGARYLRPWWFHEVVVEREVSALLEHDGDLLMLESYDYQPCEPPCRAGRLWRRRGDQEEMLLEDPDLVHAGRALFVGSQLVVAGCPVALMGDRCWLAVADLEAKTVRKLRNTTGAEGFIPYGEGVVWSDEERIVRQPLAAPGGSDEPVVLVEGKGDQAPGMWMVVGDELLWFDRAGKLSRKPMAGGRAKVVGEEGEPPYSLTVLDRALYWTLRSKPDVRALSLDASAAGGGAPRTLAAEICPEARVRVLGEGLYLECPGNPERHGELLELPTDGSAPRALLQTDEPGSFMHLSLVGERFFWWEQASEALYTAPRSGGEVRSLMEGVVPHAIAVVGGSVFVSDQSVMRVVRAEW